MNPLSFVAQYIPFLNNSFFHYKSAPASLDLALNATLTNISPTNIFSLMNEHIILTLAFLFLITLIIGEFSFIRDLRKNKISYNLKNEIDKELKDRKIKCFLIAMILSVSFAFVLPVVLFLLVLFIYIFALLILNIGYYLMLLLNILIIGVVGYYAIKFLFNVIYKVNRKIGLSIIKFETEEEYNARQINYKFKDGEEVILKTDLIIGNEYGGREFKNYKAKNKGKILIVIKHNLESNNQMMLKDKESGNKCRGVYTDEMLDKAGLTENKIIKTELDNK